MAYITPKDLYQKLLAANIKGHSGKIIFDYLNIAVEVNEKSSIGYLFQEWLGKWMEGQNIEYRTNPNTQDFPDYYLHCTSDMEDLLEIKTFDADASPNFDVANFDAYTRSLLTAPHKVNADYLIFSYTFRNGVFSIKNIWLKKIWDITGPMEGRPIRLQVKQNVFVNIRPMTWYSDRSKFKPFGNRDTFLNELHKAILMNPKKTDWNKETWLETVTENL